ncbi:hypothetical protein NE865_14492 [Phthorimaea operculella]|nr:hypothetical protein NE865_14492 [Phthorimaea operculella]
MARFQEEEILKKPMKTVEIYGKNVRALIDSGSDVNLIAVQCLHDVVLPVCEPSNVVLSGLGSGKVCALGLISTTVSIDSETYKDVKIHVVPNNVMPFQMIVGNQLLFQTLMVMDHGNVVLMRSSDEWLRNLTCFPHTGFARRTSQVMCSIVNDAQSIPTVYV